MAANHAQHLANLRQSFFDQQLLNGQFFQYEAMDVGLRGFLEDYYTTYFREAERCIGILGQQLQGNPLNLGAIETGFRQFRANTTNAGAVRVLANINRCLEYSAAMNIAGCFACLEDVKNEVKYLKRQMKNYFKLKRQGPPTVIDDNPDFGDEDSDE